uniref:Uncharacterized protein n=1 Tax=Arundo donax TaxID=35708 RepID=A0A0A9A9Y6_ARUDO
MSFCLFTNAFLYFLSFFLFF